jgi:eight-cysteine-cluster-containing protein
MRWYWGLLILIGIAAVYSFLQSGQHIPWVSEYFAGAGIDPRGWYHLPTVKDLTATPTIAPIYQGGNTRYSQGSCARDSDCEVTGCSKEVCASQETISSCEVRYDFPQAEGYTCGCVNYHCGWRY